MQLALTAPTDGSVVSVSRIKVFGTVDPANASVRVAGTPVHVAGGRFAHWIGLRTGLSHIKIVANAPGFTPARLNLAVHSIPARPMRSAPNPAYSAIEAGVPVSSATRARSYAPTTQATILRTCESAAGDTPGAASRCHCFLSYLEARVPEHRIAAWERSFFKGEATLPRWAREGGLACRSA